MKVSLVVLAGGKQEGKVIDVKLSQFLVGRDPQCHLRPASPMISKRHCALIQREGKLFVRDFDSTNGTLVNDQPVKGEVELHHDDRLKVGPLQFAVRVEEGVPASRPTPPPPTKGTAQAAAAPKPTSPTPARASVGGDAEEDIAAMLLSLQDDSSAGSLTSPSDPSAPQIPDGSTVMDMKAPAGAAGDKDKASGNTSSAAKS